MTATTDQLFDEQGRIYMAGIEQELDRDRSTIRIWEEKGWLPSELQFHRDEREWRYWTRDQLDRAKEWMGERHQGRVAAGRRSASS